MTTSRVVELHRTGPPDVLTVGVRTLAPLASGEARVRVLASAINHSDLRIRAGDWAIRKPSPFPYVPGLETVGVVAEVASDVTSVRPDDRVWTMMQGLGGVRAERDGGYAEHVTVAATSLAPLPTDRDPIELAALGLAAVTAIESLRRVGDVRGKTVAISGTTGGVGAVAVDVARALGATVVSLTRSTPLAPASVDAVVDGVGGPLFAMLVAGLRPGGRYCMYGAAAGGDVMFDAWGLLDDRVLTGYSSEALDGDALRRATLLAMKLPAPPVTVMPLAEAARAHALLESRALHGRVVLVP
jgi:NADPH:quinone reductase